MKYLDSTNLIALSTYLDRLDIGDGILNGILESYSCKVAGSDKKLFKSLDRELETQYSASLEPSAPHSLHGSFDHNASAALSISPFGPLTSSAGRKTMIYLISTLNACFVDYDFSNSKPDQFRKESNISMVINSVNTSLQAIIPNYKSEVQERLWTSIDQEISLSKTEVYSYIAESPDPFTEEGVIWSFNYFFYNKSMKRIIFFCCRLLNKALEIANSRDYMNLSRDDDDDDIFEYNEYDDAIGDNMEMDM